MSLIKKIADQIVPKTPQIIFARKCQAKMQELHLSERDMREIFAYGEPARKNKQIVVKQFNGYEIGLYYFMNDQGNYIITSVWKR
jgi:hypothetical protein